MGRRAARAAVHETERAREGGSRQIRLDGTEAHGPRALGESPCVALREVRGLPALGQDEPGRSVRRAARFIRLSLFSTNPMKRHKRRISQIDILITIAW